MNINEYASKKLKELRIQKNLTQEELAKNLNISQQQIARYENNQRQFKQDFLFVLAEYFEVSVNEFFPPIISNASEALNDTLGYKYISESQLAILTNLPIREIRDITSGKNILPKPSSLIKIGNVLDDNQDENLAFDLLVSAGYVEDPSDPINELYNTEIRYLLKDKERIALCNYLCELWNSEQNKHIYTNKEIYDTIFENDKEYFSINEVRNIFIYHNSNVQIFYKYFSKYLNDYLNSNKKLIKNENNQDIINISDLNDKNKEQIKYIIYLMKKNNDKEDIK